MSSAKPHMVRLDTQEIIPVDRKLTLGRHPRCDYVITINTESAGISGRHASIEVEGEYAWIEDLGSTNGTWVRGARIDKRTPLLPGERFLLDSVEFEFRAGAQAGATVVAPMYEKTVMSGLRSSSLPPLPVSIEDSAPRLRPAIPVAAPVLAPAAPKRAAPAASREAPARRQAASGLPREDVPLQAKSSRSTLMYLAAGFVALAGAAIVLLLSRT
jgi:pSer/pThr/pTyr-binding forkhead associated (FHA) protein